MTTQTDMTQASFNKGTSAGGVAEAQRRAGSETVLRPPVDIYESGDAITLKADMPGVSKDRLDLRVEGRSLLIEGIIGITPSGEMTALHADVQSNVYRRSFVLSNELETTKIDANLKDGVLTVRIPKRAELRPRRIEITG